MVIEHIRDKLNTVRHPAGGFSHRTFSGRFVNTIKYHRRPSVALQGTGIKESVDARHKFNHTT